MIYRGLLMAAALTCALVSAQAAIADDADMSFAFQDMQPVTPPNSPVVITVLPQTRHMDRATTMAAIVAIEHNRENHTALAFFTVFDCARHEFQIQMVGRIGNAPNERLIVADLAKPSESDAAMSPVAESPWGGAVEQVACGAE